MTQEANTFMVQNPMDKERKIIVVEDNLDFRESMVEYLELEGLAVTGVSSALEFYKALARGERYLLAIVDIGLPDQNGHVLAGYIRKNTNMRIVMLTAQSSLDSRVKAYQAGADLYLVKPIDFSELTASISSILGRLETNIPEPQITSLAEQMQLEKERPWTLHRNDETLSTPEGDQISLTSKEFYLVELLATRPETLVGREELLWSLDYQNDELGNRALDALVHRLRRKKEALDQRLPIKTVHGAGYSFSAPIVIE